MNDLLPYPLRAYFRNKSLKLNLKSSVPIVKNFSVEKTIRKEDISIVIPVKNNQEGIEKFLKSLTVTLSEKEYPLEVIIIDNNSYTPLKLTETYAFPVRVLECKKLGPGAARNVGAAVAKGKWILFTDSDCIPTPTLISGYELEDNDAVAYAGLVKIDGDDIYAQFYRDQNIFYPMALIEVPEQVPLTLVTANCLVLKSAFMAINGFNETFIYAGGEDTDLGLRLRMIGKLKYNKVSVARHEMNDGLPGFINRFMRYGRGQRLLDRHYDNPSFFVPQPIGQLNNPNEANKLLAEMHFCAMSWGFRAEEIPEFK